MDYSYEEIRQVAIDLLAGREKCGWDLSQYEHLQRCVAEVLGRRADGESRGGNQDPFGPALSGGDADLCLEVFWDLFRQGVITIGLNDANREFPFFRVSSFGRRVLESEDAYFFHDVGTFERLVRENIPKIDDLTLVYLKEAVQAFKSGCILSATVMLGVAAEHTFLKILEVIAQNEDWSEAFKNVQVERTVLRQFTKFKNILEQQKKDLPADVREDLDTNLAGIQSLLRNFRNEAGHPTGRIVSREQAYVLLNLFIPYAKKAYELIAFFGGNVVGGDANTA